jgi:hypothetical protein
VGCAVHAQCIRKVGGIGETKALQAGGGRWRAGGGGGGFFKYPSKLTKAGACAAASGSCIYNSALKSIQCKGYVK